MPTRPWPRAGAPPGCAGRRRRHAGGAGRRLRRGRHHAAQRPGGAAGGAWRTRAAARTEGRCAAARHLVVGTLVDAADRRVAGCARCRHGRCAGVGRAVGRAGGRAGVHGRRRRGRPGARAAAAGLHGPGGASRGRARRGPCDEVHQQPDHVDDLQRHHGRPGAGQAPRARPGGNGRGAESIDRRIVDHAQPHRAARAQRQLRRPIQAGADAQGHRHRDGTGARRQLPMPLSGLGQQLWGRRAAAGPGASVSELARWVETQAATPVTPGGHAS